MSPFGGPCPHPPVTLHHIRHQHRKKVNYRDRRIVLSNLDHSGTEYVCPLCHNYAHYKNQIISGETISEFFAAVGPPPLCWGRQKTVKMIVENFLVHVIWKAYQSLFAHLAPSLIIPTPILLSLERSRYENIFPVDYNFSPYLRLIRI